MDIAMDQRYAPWPSKSPAAKLRATDTCAKCQRFVCGCAVCKYFYGCLCVYMYVCMYVPMYMQQRFTSNGRLACCDTCSKNAQSCKYVYIIYTSIHILTLAYIHTSIYVCA